MAVLVEGTSVIVRRDSIDTKFKGGWETFLDILPSAPFCHDHEIACVYFMALGDSAAFIEVLEMGGLMYVDDGRSVDIAVVDQVLGQRIAADWLQFVPDFFPVDGHNDKVAGCWFLRHPRPGVYGIHMPTGWNPGDEILFYTPQGWTYEKSLSRSNVFVPKDEISKKLKFLRREGKVEVYQNLETGKEVYMARPVIEGQGERAVFTRLEKIHHELFGIEAEMDRLRSVHDEDGLARLFYRLDSELLPAVRQTSSKSSDRNMAFSCSTAGRVLRLLDRKAEAEEAFRKANELWPGTISILLELVRCQAEQDKHKEALAFARKGVEVAPESAAAWGNLAMCLISCGERQEAREVIDHAIDLDPEDRINHADVDCYRADYNKDDFYARIL